MKSIIFSFLTLALVLFSQDAVTAISVPRDDRSGGAIISSLSYWGTVNRTGACGPDATYNYTNDAVILVASDATYGKKCDEYLKITYAGTTLTLKIVDYQLCVSGQPGCDKTILISPVVYYTLNGSFVVASADDQVSINGSYSYI